MDKQYNSVIEALIFASDEPLHISTIISAIREIDGDVSKSEEDVDAAVDELNEKYSSGDIAFNSRP